MVGATKGYGVASPQPLGRRVIAVVMSVVMAVSLMPLPGYGGMAYADDLAAAAGESLLSGDTSAQSGSIALQATGQGVASVTKQGGTAVTYDTLADALNAAREAAAGGWNTTSVTVEILTDITFNEGDSWTPIVYNQLNPITINGNGHTITGLPGSLYNKSGSGVSTLTMNDLTFASPKVTSYQGSKTPSDTTSAAVIMPYADSIVALTFNNVHIKDAMVNTDANWSGGFIGFAAGYSNANDGPVYQHITFSKCSVTDSSITGKGSCGALMGHANGSTDARIVVTDTVVSKNTITSTGSSTEKAGALFGTVGAIEPKNKEDAGLFVEATVSGNTVKSNNVVITTIYGRQGSTTGVLTLTGGSYDHAPIAESDSEWAKVDEDCNLVSGEGDSWTVVKLPPVAQVVPTEGETKDYETLAEAVAAAPAGSTIILGRSADVLTYELPNIPYNITIKGGTEGVVISHTGSGNIASVPNGATFENVAFNFGSDNNNYHGFQAAGKITMNDCTLNGKLFSYGDMVFHACSFVQDGKDYHMWDYAGDVTYDGCTFTNNQLGKFLNIYNEGNGPHTVTVKNCTFINNGTEDKAALNVKATCGTKPLQYTVNFDGENKTQGAFPSPSKSDKLIIFSSLLQVDDINAAVADETAIFENGKTLYTTCAASVTDDKGVTKSYRTLQKAVDTAYSSMTGNVTVKLLTDIKDYVVIRQKQDLNLIIDGDNQSRTIQGQIIIDGDGRHTGKETLTIKGISFEGDPNDFLQKDGKAFVSAFVTVPNVKNLPSPYDRDSFNYAHNITISNCSFSSGHKNEKNEYDVVGFNATTGATCYNFIMDTVSGVGLHSLGQLNATEGGAFRNCSVRDSESGVNISGGGRDFYFVDNVFDCDTSSGYGVRMKSGYNGTIYVHKNSFTAGAALVLGKGKTKTNDPVGNFVVDDGVYVGILENAMSDSGTGKFVISGGRFSAEITVDKCAAAYLPKNNGYSDTPQTPNGVVAAAAKIVTGDTTTYYETLADAVSAVNADGSVTEPVTIIMIGDDANKADVAVSKPINLESGTFKIASQITANGGATLTITGTGDFEKAPNADGGGIVKLQGGKYPKDVNNLCPDGYYASPNGEGKFVVTNGDPVAQIGSYKYASLFDALTAANSGSDSSVTIMVLKDVTEKIGAFEIKKGKKIRVDTSVSPGVSVNFESGYFCPINGDLTFGQNVTVSKLPSAYSCSEGSLTFETDATLSAFWAYYGVVNVEKSAHVHMGLGDGVVQMAGGTVNVEGNIAAGAAATKNVSELSTNEAQLDGGYIQYRFDEPVMNLKNAYVTTSWVKYVSGDPSSTFRLNLDNSILRVHFPDSASGSIFDLGAEPTGIITMSGSQLSAAGGLVINPTDTLSMDYKSKLSAGVFTNNGKIQVDVDGLAKEALPVTIVNYTSETENAAGTIELVNNNDHYVVVDDGKGQIQIAASVATVTRAGAMESAGYYASLADAFAAAEDGDTVSLRGDLTQDDGVVFNKAGADVTLDLAEHTFTVNTGSTVNNRAIRIDNGTLRAKNGTVVAKGSGTTKETGTGCYGAFRVEAGGTLYADKLELKNARPWGLNVKVCGGKAYLNGVTVDSSYGGGIEVTEASLGEKSQTGYAELTGCTFTQTGYFDHASTCLAVSGGSELVVNSGTYTSANYALYVFSSGGVITVKDGTFEGARGDNNTAIKAEIDTSSYPEYKGGLKLEGGLYKGGFDVKFPASMTVSGGCFSENPSAYLAPDYCAVANKGTNKGVYPFAVGEMSLEKSESKATVTPEDSVSKVDVTLKRGEGVASLGDISNDGIEDAVQKLFAEEMTSDNPTVTFEVRADEKPQEGGEATPTKLTYDVKLLAVSTKSGSTASVETEVTNDQLNAGASFTFSLPVGNLANNGDLVKVTHRYKDNATDKSDTFHAQVVNGSVSITTTHFSEFELTKANSGVSVVSIDGTGYESIAKALEAIADASTNTTIKVNVSHSLTSAVEIKKAVTLDLNGCTVTQSGDNRLKVGTSGALTIADSSATNGSTIGTGAIVGGSSGISVEGGTLDFKGGTVSGDGSGYSALGTGSVGGTINVSGGAVKAAGSDAAVALKAEAGTINVSGGLIEGELDKNSGTFAVAGGVFSTKIDAGYIQSGYNLIYNPDSATAEQYPYTVSDSAVARIGDMNYTTLSDALKTANESDSDEVTITVLKNFTETLTITTVEKRIVFAKETDATSPLELTLSSGVAVTFLKGFELPEGFKIAGKEIFRLDVGVERAPNGTVTNIASPIEVNSIRFLSTTANVSQSGKLTVGNECLIGVNSGTTLTITGSLANALDTSASLGDSQVSGRFNLSDGDNELIVNNSYVRQLWVDLKDGGNKIMLNNSVLELVYKGGLTASARWGGEGEKTPSGGDTVVLNKSRIVRTSETVGNVTINRPEEKLVMDYSSSIVAGEFTNAGTVEVDVSGLAADASANGSLPKKVIEYKTKGAGSTGTIKPVNNTGTTKYAVVDDDQGTVSIVKASCSVAHANDPTTAEPTYYPTLAQAIGAAQAGDVISLTEDETLSAALAISMGITLDLNGHKITQSGDNRLSVSGATVTVKDSSADKTGEIAGGTYGIAVSGGGTVNLEGGAITGATTASLYAGPEDSAGTVNTVNVKGGKVAGELKAETGGTIAASGGLFEKPVGLEHIASGSFLMYNEDAATRGSYPYQVSDGAVAKIAVEGVGDVYFKTLQAAIDKAGTTATSIALVANSPAGARVENGQSITLDLAGWDISAATGDALLNAGTLAVSDSGRAVESENGKTYGTVSAQDSRAAAVANVPGAHAKLSGGAYQSAKWYAIKNLGSMEIGGAVTVQKPAGSTDTSSLIDNGWFGSTANDTLGGTDYSGTASKAASLTITGGTFTGKGGAKSCSVVKNDDYGTLNITGGTFDSTNNTGTSDAATLLNFGTATVSGGYFVGQYPISNGGYGTAADPCDLKISGGTFVSKGGGLMGAGGGSSDAAKVEISGGFFVGNLTGSTSYKTVVSGGCFTEGIGENVKLAAGFALAGDDSGPYKYRAVKSPAPIFAKLHDNATDRPLPDDEIIANGAVASAESGNVITVTYTGDALNQHVNAEGTKAYWLGVGVPQLANVTGATAVTYAAGFGDYNASAAEAATPDSAQTQDGVTYDTFYFGSRAGVPGNAFVAATYTFGEAADGQPGTQKSSASYTVVYVLDFSGVSTAAASLEVNGARTYYDSLAGAFQAVAALESPAGDCTITLLRDETVTAGCELNRAGANVTLDLRDYTYRASADAAVQVKNGTLRVIGTGGAIEATEGVGISAAEGTSLTVGAGAAVAGKTAGVKLDGAALAVLPNATVKATDASGNAIEATGASKVVIGDEGLAGAAQDVFVIGGTSGKAVSLGDDARAVVQGGYLSDDELNEAFPDKVVYPSGRALVQTTVGGVSRYAPGYSLSAFDMAAASQVYTGGKVVPAVTFTPLFGGAGVGTRDFTITKYEKKGDGTDAWSGATAEDLVTVGTYRLTATGSAGSMYEGTQQTCEFTIEPASIASCTVAPLAPETYTGTERKPVPAVTDGMRTLAKGTDYTVVYAQNTNVGIAAVTIAGMGNYTGTTMAYFAINRAGSSDVQIADIDAQNYNGTAKTPDVTVSKGSASLAPNTDYDLAYYNNVNAGTATVIATLKGNYEGAVTKTFTIAPAEVAVPQVQSFDYDGTEKTGVAAGANYTLTGTAHATEPGTYTAVATLNSANYVWSGGAVGPKEFSWTINAPVAMIGSAYYSSLSAAVSAAGADATITMVADAVLDAQVVVGKKITLDLNGHKLRNTVDIWNNDTAKSWSLVSVQTDGNLTIVDSSADGSGGLIAKDNDCYALDVRDGGKLTVKGGTYVGNISAVYVRLGEAVIEGGDFSAVQKDTKTQDYRFLVNLYDEARADGTAKATITGGTFHGFNPANNLAEGANTNFTPLGWTGAAVADDVWRVIEQVRVAKPAASGSLTYSGVEQVGVTYDDKQLGVAYELSAGQVKATNAADYSATFRLKEGYIWVEGSALSEDDVTVSWSIAKASATVKANDVSKTHGASDPALTATVTGAVNGETLGYTLARVTGEDVGTYAITPTPTDSAVNGNYVITVEAGIFTISPDVVTVPSAATGLIYNGAEQTGVAEGTGYAVSGGRAVNAGAHSATVTLADAHNSQWADDTTADKTIPWEIAKKAAAVTVSDLTVTAGTAITTFTALSSDLATGDVIGDVVSGFTVTDASGATVAQADWGRNAGTYTVRPTLEGAQAANYVVSATNGTLTVTSSYTPPTPTPTPTSISTGTLTVGSGGTYTGAAKEPAVTVRLGTTTVPASGYVLRYSNNVSAGTATVVATGQGSYSGSLTGTFVISPASLEAVEIADIPNQAYTGSAITPALAVSLGGTALVAGRDYEVAYSDNVNVGTATVAITGIGNYAGTKGATFSIVDSAPVVTEVNVYRLYNPNTGEHFYTTDSEERDHLADLGWRTEGVGWVAPVVSSVEVYRLYNPNSGDHHYTVDAEERDSLVEVGWRYEHVEFYGVEGEGGIPLWRLYNPNAEVGAHHFTIDKEEYDHLAEVGWRPEGMAWRAIR